MLNPRQYTQVIPAYVPTLALSVAEMQALEHLPDASKKHLLPAIQLMPWVNAKNFERAVERVEKAYGKERAWIANLDARYEKKTDGGSKEFDKLKEPADGYKNWCDFVRGHENIIPSVQLEETEQLAHQIKILSELKRGLVFHLSPERLAAINDSSAIRKVLDGAKGLRALFIIMDFGKIDKQTINPEHRYLRKCISDLKKFPLIGHATTIISGSSFPTKFDIGHSEQNIYERQLYNGAKNLSRKIGIPENFVYGDHASVAIQNKKPAFARYARIDLASKDKWCFFKANEQFESGMSRSALYQKVATDAVESAPWDTNLRTWGTIMIENTKKGGLFPINSPRQNVAARINTHLHQQAFYSRTREETTRDFKDQWVD